MTENADKAEREQADAIERLQADQKNLGIRFNEAPKMATLESALSATIVVKPDMTANGGGAWSGLHPEPGEVLYLRREFLVKITGASREWQERVRDYYGGGLFPAAQPTREEVDLALDAPSEVIDPEDDELGDPTVDLDAESGETFAGSAPLFITGERTIHISNPTDPNTPFHKMFSESTLEDELGNHTVDLDAESGTSFGEKVEFFREGTSPWAPGIVITDEVKDGIARDLAEAIKNSDGRLIATGSSIDPAAPFPKLFDDPRTKDPAKVMITDYWKRRADEALQEAQEEDLYRPFRVGDQVNIQKIPEMSIGGYTGPGYLVRRAPDGTEETIPAPKSFDEPYRSEGVTNPFGEDTPIYNRMIGELLAKRLREPRKVVIGVDPATGATAVAFPSGRIMMLPDDIEQSSPFVD